MLATVERHMQSAQSSPATSGLLSQASTAAVPTQLQQVMTMSVRTWRSAANRGASSAPARAPAETQVMTKPPPRPERPLSEKTASAEKVRAPKEKFMPSPKTSNTVRR